MNFLSFLPKGATIKQLIIVGPYPSYEYISKLIGKNGISKENLFLIVDDAWDIDAFKSNGYKIRQVCAEETGGLVHTKMYYVHYKMNGENGVRKMLVTGSANASQNGMQKNAELLSFYRKKLFCNNKVVCNGKKIDLLDQYFEKLKNGKTTKSLLLKMADVTDGTMLYLPAIRHYENNEDFYSWIRSGMLCYKYDQDGNFGHYEIDLKEPLPTGLNFSNTIFRGLNKKELKKIRIPYLDNISWSNKGNIQIKSYGIETCYGYWISKKCYEECSDSIFTKKLKRTLEEYVSDKQKNIHQLAANIVEGIRDFKKKNKSKKDDLDVCFSRINLKFIKEGLKSKIDRDLKKARDKVFAARYESGFAVNKMPRLDDDEFDEFINSFFEFCKMKGSYRCKNKFSKRLKQLVVDLDENYDDMSDDELKQWVISNWREEFYEDDEENTTMYGDYLKNYYNEADDN